MTAPRIVLAGFGTSTTGLTWESDRALRIGRKQNLEVVLNDHSVDRLHAEIKYYGMRWVLHDLAKKPAYPVRVNGQPLVAGDHGLHLDDVIQVGNAYLRVILLHREIEQEALKKTMAIRRLAPEKSPAPFIDFAADRESCQLTERMQALVTRTVTSLARGAEMRDHYSCDHPRRVTDYSMLLADVLNLSALEKSHLRIGAPLHDIGKLSLQHRILGKPGKLTAGEFAHIKSHTIQGARMLDPMAHLLPTIPIVRHHHECWDGSGYPDGLTHEQIPLLARIVSVADTFDAMTSPRPYRPALSVEQAFIELIRQAGTHFDPACVYAFLRLRPKIEAIVNESRSAILRLDEPKTVNLPNQFVK